MSTILITAAADARVSTLQASLQVALHVTKRQDGAKATDRPTVSVQNRRTIVSEEAQGKAVSLSPSKR